MLYLIVLGLVVSLKRLPVAFSQAVAINELFYMILNTKSRSPDLLVMRLLSSA